jgi:hypothetical protein
MTSALLNHLPEVVAVMPEINLEGFHSPPWTFSARLSSKRKSAEIGVRSDGSEVRRKYLNILGIFKPLFSKPVPESGEQKGGVRKKCLKNVTINDQAAIGESLWRPC